MIPFWWRHGGDMATEKLTKRLVDSLKPGPKPYTVYDIDLKGFSIRIAPSGSKTWQAEYRPYPGGRDVNKTRMSLGSAGTLAPAEARRKARDILTEAAKGGDPAKERGSNRREIKVGSLIDLYEAEGCFVLRGLRQGQAMKPATKAYTLARLRNHVAPLIGGKRISEIAAADIEKM